MLVIEIEKDNDLFIIRAFENDALIFLSTANSEYECILQLVRFRGDMP